MKNLVYICLLLMACNAKPSQQGDRSNAETNPAGASTHAGNFDLAKLSLTENLMAMMEAEGVKPDRMDTTYTTMMDFEVFKTSNPKILRFENTDLSGSNAKNTNYILFHYNEKKNTLAGYELWLYNQKQTDQLIKLLDKTGQLTFKQTKLPEGTIELDANGNEVKPENAEHKTFRVWENKSTGVSYFLTTTGTGNHLVANLVVLKRDTPFGKYWVDMLQLDWYKNEKSEPLP